MLASRELINQAKKFDIQLMEGRSGWQIMAGGLLIMDGLSHKDALDSLKIMVNQSIKIKRCMAERRA